MAEQMQHAAAPSAATPSVEQLLAALQQQTAIAQQMQQRLALLEAGQSAAQRASVLDASASSAAAPAPSLSAAQLLALSSLPSVPAFDGSGSAAGLAARQWLQRAELAFKAREAALGIASASHEASVSRVLTAAAALSGGALAWFSSLADRQPQTWTEFKAVFERRYQALPAVQVLEQKLQRVADAAAKVRGRLTLEGLQRYSSQFLQLASEIDDDTLTAHSKFMLYAQGLRDNSREYVLRRDTERPRPPLSAVMDEVLRRAAHKGFAAGDAYSSGGSSEAMELDALMLCTASFGITREEAAAYLEPASGPSDSSSLTGSPVAPPGEASVEALMAAITARFGSSSSSARAAPGRRSGAAAAREVPKALADARKAAGLCIKCGVKKYEPGQGHNSRTCSAAADKSTSPEEGKARAARSGDFQ